MPESNRSFVERLGQWVGFTDALPLYRALNAGGAGTSQARSPAPSMERAAARMAFDRVRSALADSMSAHRPSAPTPHAPSGSAADFAPYHRHYLARQRDMSASIGPLRASVRAALSGRSPAHARLAAIDAVLEQAWAARERKLLATIPLLLAKRFERLCETRPQGEAQDDPPRSAQPDAGLATFCAQMHAVLLAELDLRLQPVAGLIAALESEVAQQP